MRDKNNTITQRYEWLDVAKGIAILLMILGHTSVPEPVNRFIFAFHMPLFFIASGYCTNWGKNTFLKFLAHKSRTLLVPFFIYSALVLLIGVPTGQMDLIGVLKGGWASNCYPLWFVSILFFSLLLAKGIMAISNEKLRLFVWLSMAVVGSILKYKLIYLPYTLSPVFYASFLLIAGTYAKKLECFIISPQWWALVFSFFITAIISHFWKVNMSWNTINPVFFITLGAFSGTYMIFGVSSIIERKMHFSTRILTFFGKETYVLLAFSSIVPSTIDVVYPMNAVIKYLITFSILLLIIYLKNKVNKAVGYNLL